MKVIEEDIRKEFKGEAMINPITGRKEPMYPPSKRYQKYFESFLICAPFFGFVLFL
jgi:hypothetical protein